MRKIFSFLSLGVAYHQQQSTKIHLNALRFYCDSAPSKNPGLLSCYRSLVSEGKLQQDPYQEKVAIELENLLGRLEQFEKDMEEYHVKLAEWEDTRENERRSLLMKEGEAKQQGGDENFMQRWMSRRKPAKMETGVGKWVSYLNRERKLDSVVGRRPDPPPPPKGLYLYGNVGSGKTMLMDMFYAATKGMVKHRRRFHFHEAMLQVNEHMHKIWKHQVEEKSSQSSISSWVMNLPFDSKVKDWIAAEEKYKQEMQMKHILPAVADKFLVDEQTDQKGASILCFDEIQTVDVFAIVALSGILSRLLSTGTVLVATSNRAPNDLNQDGMQKEIFQKFLAKLEKHCQYLFIGSEIDYRRLKAEKSADQVNVRINVHYFSPLDSIKRVEFENTWKKITGLHGGAITSKTIKVMFGRTLEVPEYCNGVARFPFEYLCGRPLGAADYIAVAKSFHTVFISDIPIMSMRIRDKARRFITLIDELYNYHCRLYCSAESSIDNLFQGTEEGTLFDLESFQFETETEDTKLRRDVLSEGKVSSGGSPTGIISLMSGQEEMFAFRRAVSRLIEMQTPLYYEAVEHHHPFFQYQHRETKIASANT